MQSGGSVGFCGLMGVWERNLCDALERAGRNAGPGRLLAEAKVLEWSAARLFRSPPTREKRISTPCPAARSRGHCNFLHRTSMRRSI